MGTSGFVCCNAFVIDSVLSSNPVSEKCARARFTGENVVKLMVIFGLLSVHSFVRVPVFRKNTVLLSSGHCFSEQLETAHQRRPPNVAVKTSKSTYTYSSLFWGLWNWVYLKSQSSRINSLPKSESFRKLLETKHRKT
jgi:hypothetical protein